MGKIIKKSVEKITINKQKFSLGMKGEFKIEFANDSFGPYNYKFERTDCYFNDGLNDRGTKIFPLRNKSFNNTEIFLETDDIVIAVGERGSLMGGDKTFLDIINIKTEQKQRIFTDEVNLIYNSKDSIIINCKIDEVFKTFKLDFKTLLIQDETEEELQAFFKCVYSVLENKWFLIDFNVGNIHEKDQEKKYQNGFFKLKKVNIKGKPELFDRGNFLVKNDFVKIDLWKKSEIHIKENLINNQNYILGKIEKKIILSNYISKNIFKKTLSYINFINGFLLIFLGVILLFIILKNFNFYEDVNILFFSTLFISPLLFIIPGIKLLKNKKIKSFADYFFLEKKYIINSILITILRFMPIYLPFIIFGYINKPLYMLYAYIIEFIIFIILVNNKKISILYEKYDRKYNEIDIFKKLNNKFYDKLIYKLNFLNILLLPITIISFLIIYLYSFIFNINKYYLSKIKLNKYKKNDFDFSNYSIVKK